MEENLKIKKAFLNYEDRMKQKELYMKIYYNLEKIYYIEKSSWKNIKENTL